MEILKTLKAHEKTIKSRFKVKRIGLFGSVVRGEARENSDVDVLVEFEEGFKTYDNYIELQFYLEDTLGKRVDLVILEAVKHQLRAIIEKEAVYA